jgi:hypothetical protein
MKLRLRYELACAILAVSVASSIALGQPAFTDSAQAPPAPSETPAARSAPFLEAYAAGTRDYICLPSASGVSWTSVTAPSALFPEVGLTRNLRHDSPFVRGTAYTRYAGPVQSSARPLPLFTLTQQAPVGAAAPSTGCSQPSDIGTTVLVRYTVEYLFFQPGPEHFAGSTRNFAPATAAAPAAYIHPKELTFR